MATRPHSRNIKTDLAAAVFHSVYTSRTQRQRRLLAGLVLTTKHALRGLLFSWPLYFMVYAGFRSDAPVNWLLWALGIPGIGISLFILARGVREEYRNRVAKKLFNWPDLARLMRVSGVV